MFCQSSDNSDQRSFYLRLFLRSADVFKNSYEYKADEEQQVKDIRNTQIVIVKWVSELNFSCQNSRMSIPFLKVLL
jgi:hypothetical protein